MHRLLLFIAVIIPFQVALSPLVSFDVALSRVLVLIALLILITNVLITKKIYFTRSFISLYIILFLLSGLLSLLSADDTSWFLRKFIFLLNFFTLFFIIISAIPSYNSALTIIRAVTVSGIVSAFFALLLWIGQFIIGADAIMGFWQAFIAPIFLGHTISSSVTTYSSAYVHISGADYMRLIGFFPDPHTASFFFNLLLPFSVAFTVYAKKLCLKTLWGIGSIILFISVLATFTRGAYVALFVGFLCFFVYTLFLLYHSGSLRTLFVTISASFIILLIILYSPLSVRFSSILSNHDSSITERFAIWDDAIDTIRTKPFLGTGLGNYPLSVNTHANYRDPYYAHNLYLDIAVETGLLTALLWILIIITAIWRFLRWHMAPFGIAGALSLIIYSVHSLFDTSLFSVHTLPLLMIILAFATYWKK